VVEKNRNIDSQSNFCWLELPVGGFSDNLVGNVYNIDIEGVERQCLLKTDGFGCLFSIRILCFSYYVGLIIVVYVMNYLYCTNMKWLHSCHPTLMLGKGSFGCTEMIPLLKRSGWKDDSSMTLIFSLTVIF
jgi:hypothetical protein